MLKNNAFPLELSTQKIGLIGTVTFLILGIMSLLFYKERVIVMDMAYYSFEIVRTGSFTMQNNRFGSILTQILPVIGVKLHLPLKTVLMLYSLNIALFPFIFFSLSLIY